MVNNWDSYPFFLILISSCNLFHKPFEFHYSTLSDPNGCIGALESVDYSKWISLVQTDEESYGIVDLFKIIFLHFYEQPN